MSGATKMGENLQAGTSGTMESAVMETEEYYNPESGEWSQKVDTGQLCRVCANPNEYLIPIFDGEGLEHELGMKIEKHLPIKVAETDTLPRQMCYQCASTLIAWHDLVLACIEADKKLKEMQAEEVDDDDDKGADMFESHTMDDSEPGEEVDQPSTSEQSQVAKLPAVKKTVPVKEKKPKLKMVLVKGSAGTSGQKTATKTPVAKTLESAKSKEGSNQDSSSERCNTLSAQSATLRTKKLQSSRNKILSSSTPLKYSSEPEIKVEPLEWKPDALGKLSSPHFQEKREFKTETGSEVENKELSQIAHSEFGIFESAVEGLIQQVATITRQRKITLNTQHCVSEKGDKKERGVYTSVSKSDFNKNIKTAVQVEKDKIEQDLVLNSNKENLSADDTNIVGKRKKCFKCKECNEKFSSQSGLDSHVEIHNKDDNIILGCSKCERVFETNDLLIEHEKTHDDSSFSCNDCPKKFKSQVLLAAHVKNHRYYRCRLCSKKFIRKSAIERHKLHFHPDTNTNSVKLENSALQKVTVSPDKRCKTKTQANSGLYDSFCFQCTYCPKKFSLQSVLTAHMVKHKKETTHTCAICNQSFENETEHDKHMCVLTDISIDALVDQHKGLEEVYEILEFEQPPVLSPVSPQELITDNLKSVDEDNINGREIPNLEKECNSVVAADEVNNDSSKKYHFHADTSSETEEENNFAGFVEVSSNTSEPVITCNKKSEEKSIENGVIENSIPNKNRSTSEDNKVNVSGEVKPSGNICKFCGRKLNHRSGLIRHIRTVHEKRRDFKCSFCFRGFCEKVGRDDHERLHTGEKPFKCDVCNKSFRSKAMVYTHKKYHFKSPENYRFQCTHCPKRYPFQSALKAHMRLHTGERQYKCTLCTKEFFRRVDVARHMLRYHPNEAEDSKKEPKGKSVSKEVSTETVRKVDLLYEANSSPKVGRKRENIALLREYKCDSCERAFFDKRSMEVHALIHTGERPHTCQTCGMQFRQTGALRRHIRIVHEGKRDFECEICGKCFGEKVSRDDHIRVHTGERPYPCEVCRKSFKSKIALSIHKKLHLQVFPHQCVICEKGFRFPGKLAIHMKTHTGEEKEKPHGCDECNKSFASRQELTSHMRTHSKEMSYTCDVCGNQYKHNAGLYRHMRIVHQGRRDFPCHICPKRFTERVSRDDHIRTHTGERPFPCVKCGKRFKTKSALYIHKRFHNQTYKYPCPCCNKRFQTRSRMTEHVCTHTGERPFTCDVCGKGFVNRREMLNHKVIHSNEKPFVCAVCGMKFRLKRYMSSHMLRNHAKEETKN